MNGLDQGFYLVLTFYIQAHASKILTVPINSSKYEFHCHIEKSYSSKVRIS